MSGKNESHAGGLPRSAYALSIGPAGAKFENRTRATQVCGDGLPVGQWRLGLVRLGYRLSLQVRGDPLLGGSRRCARRSLGGVLKREA